MENDKKNCKYCGEKVDVDAIICTFCDKQMEELKGVETQRKFLNEVYQFVSPIIVFLIMLVLFRVGLSFGGMIWVAIAIIVIVNLTIFFNDFFGNQDNFILEIGKFLSYFILVEFAIVSIWILAGKVTTDGFDIIVVVVVVSSLHLRLLKYDTKHSRFTYNKSIIRIRGNVTKKTKRYPKVSPYVLYRSELYIIIIVSSIFLATTQVTDTFNTYLIAIILDVIIYLILSKFTKLLQPH